MSVVRKKKKSKILEREEAANKDVKDGREEMSLCDPQQYWCMCLCALCGHVV